MRDLFGSTLFLSLKQRTLQVLIKVWKKKTPTAKLLQELVPGVASVKPARIDVVIIDGKFFLHLLVDPPSALAQ